MIDYPLLNNRTDREFLTMENSQTPAVAPGKKTRHDMPVASPRPLPGDRSEPPPAVDTTGGNSVSTTANDPWLLAAHGFTEPAMELISEENASATSGDQSSEPEASSLSTEPRAGEPPPALDDDRERYVVTDPVALIRCPPDFLPTRERIPIGTAVTRLETCKKGGLMVAKVKRLDDQAEHWTAMSNLRVVSRSLDESAIDQTALAAASANAIASAPRGMRRDAARSIPEILGQAARLNVRMPEQVAYMLATAAHESNLGGTTIEKRNAFHQDAKNGGWYAVDHVKKQKVTASSSDELETNYWDSAYGGKLGNRKGTTDARNYRGRGFVQITGRNNYRKMSAVLNAQGYSYTLQGTAYGGQGNEPIDLERHPDHINQVPELAARLLVEGSMGGHYTAHRLGKHVNRDKVDFVNARRVINGDTAKNGASIARIALGFARALRRDEVWARVFTGGPMGAKTSRQTPNSVDTATPGRSGQSKPGSQVPAGAEGNQVAGGSKDDAREQPQDFNVQVAIEFNRARPYSRERWRTIQQVVGADIDGIPGADTARAVFDWQLNNGVAADGKVGPVTNSAIGGHATGDTGGKSDSGAAQTSDGTNLGGSRTWTRTTSKLAIECAATDDASSGHCAKGVANILKKLKYNCQRGNAHDWIASLPQAGWTKIAASPESAPEGAVLVFNSDVRMGKTPRNKGGGKFGHVEIVCVDDNGKRLYVSDKARSNWGGSVKNNFVGAYVY